MDDNGNVIKNGSANQYPPVGIRKWFDAWYTPDRYCIDQTSTNSFRYITGYDQVVWRSDFIRENKNLGIFYWDMGNDVSTSHEYSLPKASNFSLSANVDSIVTKVDKAPSITSTGITSLSSANSVKLIIAPNPVRDILYFEIGNEDSINHEVIIFNASGTRVLNEKINKKEIDVRNLYKGVYTLCVQTADNQIVSGSFVKL